MAKKSKVLIDTNVLFSGLFWQGPPHLILELMKEGLIELFLPEHVIEEAKEVIQRLKPEGTHLINELVIIYSSSIKKTPLPTTRELEEARKLLSDRDDSPILASAIKAKPDFFVSGDKGFFTTKVRRGISLAILDCRKFIERFLADNDQLHITHPEIWAKITAYLSSQD